VDSQASGYAGRKALLIGNQEYQRNALSNPRNDATDLGTRLRMLGFEVEALLDGTKSQMDLAINTFVNTVRRNDIALFYYAGHGFQSNNENYLLPVDSTDFPDEVSATEHSVKVSPIQPRLKEAGARLVIIILDACRDNPFVRYKSDSAPSGYAPMTSARGSYIAFATQPGDKAQDDPTKPNGLFTRKLLENLSVKGLSLDGVFTRTRAGVVQESARHQWPTSTSDVVGEECFNCPDVFIPPPPPDPKALAVTFCEQGQALIERNPERALDWFNQALEQKPDFPECLMARASILEKVGKLEMALGDLNRVLQFDPESPKARSASGRIHNQLRQPKSALADCGQGLKQAAPDFDALFCVGNALHQLGQHEQAIKYLADALRLRKDHYESLYLRGKSLQARDRCQEAVRDLTAAIDSRPDALDALLARAICYQGLEQHKLAVQDLNDLARAKPNDPQYRLLAAQSYYALQQYEQAAKSLQEVRLLSPDDPAALNLLGLCYLRLAQYKEAEGVYNRLIELRPLDPNPLLWRSEARKHLENLPGANDDLDKATKLERRTLASGSQRPGL
jgi:tetratricopeptide (TPR) repeat protein